jgi:hypothetical protein
MAYKSTLDTEDLKHKVPTVASSTGNKHKQASHYSSYEFVADQKHASSDDIFNFRRTVLSFDKGPKEKLPYIIGTTIYFIIFIFMIPAFLIKHEMFDVLTAYFPNVDMLATILGYDGGPNIFFEHNMWRYLYNPSNFTLTGFISTTLINYSALIGMTFIVAYTTYKTKSWKHGWALAFIMAMMTYLAPGNIIVILQNRLGVRISQEDGLPREGMLHYLLVVGIGLLIGFAIILSESLLIKHVHAWLVKVMELVVRNQKLNM